MLSQQPKNLFCLFVITSCFLLSGCSLSPHALPSNTKKVINQAKELGWHENQYPINNSFIISTYECPEKKHSKKVIRAYIEGDGNSWESKYKLSKNPTPKHPLTLELALADPYPQVVYLARPCQYTPHSLDNKCEAKYWSSHRYAKEVVSALNQTLDKIKAKRHNEGFILIGYSGGASVAALIAAQRNDIKGFISLAGDLDHKILNEYHRTTPLNGSENPILIASQLKNLPQQHWSGKKDNVVPPWMGQHFAKAVNNPKCVKTYTLEGVTHHKGWLQAWSQILATPLVCDRNNG